MKEGFIECDTCRAKPGSPILCSGCLHNREVITKLEEIVHEGYKFEPIMPIPHTDQFEEIVKEYDEKFGSGDESGDFPSNACREFLISKLHHIRRETEKGIKADMKDKMRHWHGTGPMMVDDYFSHLESDNSTQK